MCDEAWLVLRNLWALLQEGAGDTVGILNCTKQFLQQQCDFAGVSGQRVEAQYERFGRSQTWDCFRSSRPSWRHSIITSDLRQDSPKEGVRLRMPHSPGPLCRTVSGGLIHVVFRAQWSLELCHLGPDIFWTPPSEMSPGFLCWECVLSNVTSISFRQNACFH